VNHKKPLWVILIILIVVGLFGGSAYFIIQRSSLANNSENLEETVQTSVASLGEITLFTTGSGQIVPVSQVDLYFDEAGILIELYVQVGDQVKSGDLLAQLQTDKTLTQLTAEVASAELAVIQAQQALQAIYDNADMEAAQALLAVEQAQEALYDTQNLEVEKALAGEEIASALENIDEAELMLYIYESTPSEDEIYTVYASMLFREKELNEAQQRVDHTKNKIKSAPNADIRDRLKSQLLSLNLQLANTRLVYEDALYKYNRIFEASDPYEVALAEAQKNTALIRLAEAQTELDELQDGPASGDLAEAEAELAEALLNWETLKDGPDPDEIALAEAQLTTAQANLILAQNAESTVDLVAPFDATVMSVGASINEYIQSSGSNPLITLADLSEPILEVNLDETDLEYATEGNIAEIVFDAFPEQTFSGKIIHVDPALSSVFNQTTIRTLVLLDPTSYAKPQTLPVGLYATVDIIAGYTSDAVLIPVEALHETSPGDYSVYVLSDGDWEFVPVSVGLVDYTSAEILRGIAVGDIVATGNLDSEGIKP
jgi:HlyD family secretion protein